ncbi:MAG: hypothetical protein QXG73_01875 [Candidatus Micrarchaeaceae archaeon]
MEQQRQVSFSPFLSETFDVQQLRRAIMYDLEEQDGNALILHMRLLVAQVSSILDINELQDLNTRIDKIVQYQNNINLAEDDETAEAYISKIEEDGAAFLSAVAQYFFAHGLTFGLKRNKSETPFDLLASILDIKGYRYNNAGFPITWQQKVLAEFALQRVQNNYDFTLLVVGKRGRGKSTFAVEVMSEYFELQGKKITLDDIMLTEDRKKVFDIVKGWKPGSGTIFDEAINQLFSREFLQSKDFIALLTEVRYKRAFAAFLIPELFQIDKIVREGLADLVITVTERGTQGSPFGKTVVQAPSLLSGSERYMMREPSEPVLTPEAHTETLLNNSLNSITTIPFLRIPETNEFWKAYESIKNDKINAKKYTQQLQAKPRLKSDDYYYQFTTLMAKSLSPAQQVISEDEINAFAQRVSYNLTLTGYAAWLQRQTGVKKADLLLDRHGAQVIDITIPIIRSFINKMKGDMK